MCVVNHVGGGELRQVKAIQFVFSITHTQQFSSEACMYLSDHAASSCEELVL